MALTFAIPSVGVKGSFILPSNVAPGTQVKIADVFGGAEAGAPCTVKIAGHPKPSRSPLYEQILLTHLRMHSSGGDDQGGEQGPLLQRLLHASLPVAANRVRPGDQMRNNKCTSRNFCQSCFSLR